MVSNEKIDTPIRIKAEKIRYKVDDIEILKGVSLEVANKKTVGIIGPNGSGKTTFLKHIYRSIKSSENSIYLDGRTLSQYSYKDSAKAMTVVRQEGATGFDFTVESMILLGRSPYHKAFEGFNAKDREIAKNAMNAIGMTKYANHSFNALSGGEKQRVLIARSLCQQADIYVLDEPTNHLDVHYQWSIMELIKELDATVLGVFHEMNLAAAFCDEIYVLKDGSIFAHGTPSQIFTKELLAEVFGVNAEVITSSDNIPHIIIRGSRK